MKGHEQERTHATTLDLVLHEDTHNQEDRGSSYASEIGRYIVPDIIETVSDRLPNTRVKTGIEMARAAIDLANYHTDAPPDANPVLNTAISFGFDLIVNRIVENCATKFPGIHQIWPLLLASEAAEITERQIFNDEMFDTLKQVQMNAIENQNTLLVHSTLELEADFIFFRTFLKGLAWPCNIYCKAQTLVNSTADFVLDHTVTPSPLRQPIHIEVRFNEGFCKHPADHFPRQLQLFANSHDELMQISDAYRGHMFPFCFYKDGQVISIETAINYYIKGHFERPVYFNFIPTTQEKILREYQIELKNISLPGVPTHGMNLPTTGMFTADLINAEKALLGRKLFTDFYERFHPTELIGKQTCFSETKQNLTSVDSNSIQVHVKMNTHFRPDVTRVMSEAKSGTPLLTRGFLPRLQTFEAFLDDQLSPYQFYMDGKEISSQSAEAYYMSGYISGAKVSFIFDPATRAHVQEHYAIPDELTQDIILPQCSLVAYKASRTDTLKPGRMRTHFSEELKERNIPQNQENLQTICYKNFLRIFYSNHFFNSKKAPPLTTLPVNKAPEAVVIDNDMPKVKVPTACVDRSVVPDSKKQATIPAKLIMPTMQGLNTRWVTSSTPSFSFLEKKQEPTPSVRTTGHLSISNSSGKTVWSISLGLTTTNPMIGGLFILGGITIKLALDYASKRAEWNSKSPQEQKEYTLNQAIKDYLDIHDGNNNHKRKKLKTLQARSTEALYKASQQLSDNDEKKPVFELLSYAFSAHKVSALRAYSQQDEAALKKNYKEMQQQKFALRKAITECLENKQTLQAEKLITQYQKHFCTDPIVSLYSAHAAIQCGQEAIAEEHLQSAKRKCDAHDQPAIAWTELGLRSNQLKQAQEEKQKTSRLQDCTRLISTLAQFNCTSQLAGWILYEQHSTEHMIALLTFARDHTPEYRESAGSLVSYLLTHKDYNQAKAVQKELYNKYSKPQDLFDVFRISYLRDQEISNKPALMSDQETDKKPIPIPIIIQEDTYQDALTYLKCVHNQRDEENQKKIEIAINAILQFGLQTGKIDEAIHYQSEYCKQHPNLDNFSVLGELYTVQYQFLENKEKKLNAPNIVATDEQTEHVGATNKINDQDRATILAKKELVFSNLLAACEKIVNLGLAEKNQHSNNFRSACTILAEEKCRQQKFDEADEYVQHLIALPDVRAQDHLLASTICYNMGLKFSALYHIQQSSNCQDANPEDLKVLKKIFSSAVKSGLETIIVNLPILIKHFSNQSINKNYELFSFFHTLGSLSYSAYQYRAFSIMGRFSLGSRLFAFGMTSLDQLYYNLWKTHLPDKAKMALHINRQIGNFLQSGLSYYRMRAAFRAYQLASKHARVTYDVILSQFQFALSTTHLVVLTASAVTELADFIHKKCTGQNIENYYFHYLKVTSDTGLTYLALATVAVELGPPILICIGAGSKIIMSSLVGIGTVILPTIPLEDIPWDTVIDKIPWETLQAYGPYIVAGAVGLYGGYKAWHYLSGEAALEAKRSQNRTFLSNAYENYQKERYPLLVENIRQLEKNEFFTDQGHTSEQKSMGLMLKGESYLTEKKTQEAETVFLALKSDNHAPKLLRFQALIRLASLDSEKKSFISASNNIEEAKKLFQTFKDTVPANSKSSYEKSIIAEQDKLLLAEGDCLYSQNQPEAALKKISLVANPSEKILNFKQQLEIQLDYKSLNYEDGSKKCQVILEKDRENKFAISYLIEFDKQKIKKLLCDKKQASTSSEQNSTVIAELDKQLLTMLTQLENNVKNKLHILQNTKQKQQDIQPQEEKSPKEDNLQEQEETLTTLDYVRTMRGELFTQLNKLEDALTDFNAIRQKTDDIQDRIFSLEVQLLLKDDKEKAQKKCQEKLEVTPKHKLALIYSSKIYLDAKQLKLAETTLHTIISEYKEDAKMQAFAQQQLAIIDCHRGYTGRAKLKCYQVRELLTAEKSHLELMKKRHEEQSATLSPLDTPKIEESHEESARLSSMIDVLSKDIQHNETFIQNINKEISSAWQRTAVNIVMHCIDPLMKLCTQSQRHSVGPVLLPNWRSTNLSDKTFSTQQANSRSQTYKPKMGSVAYSRKQILLNGSQNTRMTAHTDITQTKTFMRTF